MALPTLLGKKCPYLVGNCYFTWHVNKVIIIIIIIIIK